jgi:hypothetical protein
VRQVAGVGKHNYGLEIVNANTIIIVIIRTGGACFSQPITHRLPGFVALGIGTATATSPPLLSNRTIEKTRSRKGPTQTWNSLLFDDSQ